MKTKPILFSTPMVQAILEGRKTQTRRIIFKKEHSLNHPDIICTGFTDGKKIAHFQGKNSLTSAAGENPKYLPGDILWVRETWRLTDFLHPSDDNYGYVYKASENGKAWESNDEGWTWKPSIFMPKAACRIFLEVTDVRVERLQDISEDDAADEGIEFNTLPLADTGDYSSYPRNYMISEKKADGWPYFGEDECIKSFQSLWESINGKESWSANPWVWVYDFKKTEKPKNFI